MKPSYFDDFHVGQEFVNQRGEDDGRDLYWKAL